MHKFTFLWYNLRHRQARNIKLSKPEPDPISKIKTRPGSRPEILRPVPALQNEIAAMTSSRQRSFVFFALDFVPISNLSDTMNELQRPVFQYPDKTLVPLGPSRTQKASSFRKRRIFFLFKSIKLSHSYLA